MKTARALVVALVSLGMLLAGTGCTGAVDDETGAVEADLSAKTQFPLGYYAVDYQASGCSPDDVAFATFTIKEHGGFDGWLPSGWQGGWDYAGSTYKTSRGTLRINESQGAFHSPKRVWVKGDILTVTSAGGGKRRFLYEVGGTSAVTLIPEAGDITCTRSVRTEIRYHTVTPQPVQPSPSPGGDDE